MKKKIGEGDWLSLVEPVGQFLTAPVLRSAFPEVLPAVPSEIRSEARERLADIAVAPNDKDRAAWLNWLLREALGWGELYRTGDEAAAVMREVPEYRTTLKSDGILRDPNGTLRVVVMRVPYGTPFAARLSGSEWSASPLDRVTELARAHGVPVALLTDGERIALVNVPISTSDAPTETSGGYAVWHTSLFAEGAEREYFAAFVALLHAQRFFNADERETLEALFKRSAVTQADLTKTLGLQVRKAVELLVGAFARADRERGGALLDALPPHTVYEAAATVMMRLVFMLYAEERDLLPIGDPTYAQYYAVSTLRDQLDTDVVRLGDEPLERRATGWRRLLATFDAIFSGIDHDRLRSPAYGGRLFDPARFAFLDACRVDDLTTLAILTSLQTVSLGGESRRLSFLALDVEQIGHVYEGLLDHDAVRVPEVYLGFEGKSGAESEIALAELERVAASGHLQLLALLVEKLDRSEKAIAKGLARGAKVMAGDEPEVRRQVMTACESDEALVRRVLPYAALLRDDLQGLPTIYAAGGIIVTKTRARRDSGTEYTPRVLAEEIVRYALEPLAYSPGPVDGAVRDTWRVKPSAELLALKICDPACGSGAFLVAACRYLAERVAEAWQREGRVADDDPIRDAQRLISERCLYGVDRDAMAVEMAKLSLWLLTFSRQRPFSFLDHAMRVGDSLLGITSLDQLRALHFDPERGRALHDGTLFDVIRPLEQLIEEAIGYRLQVEGHSTVDIADAVEKARLNSLAAERIASAIMIADAMSAVALSTSDEPSSQVDAAFVALGDAIGPALQTAGRTAELERALAEATYQIRLRIDAEKPPEAPARRPLHWPLEFPEVFSRSDAEFDLVVGNPPFLGGKFISGRFGTSYRSCLVRWLASDRRGHADLVAYFFLRAAAIARRFGFIATNTIAQGDTREVALDPLVGEGWTIGRADKSRVWPGEAAIQVAEVWCHRAVTGEPAILSGSMVRGISALLTPLSRVSGKPFRLQSNARVAFIGSLVLGLGFTMSPERASEILNLNIRNRAVLFPYMTADDLCDTPDLAARRWIVDFADRSKAESATYKESFEHVLRFVQPIRSAHKVKHYRDFWWRYARRSIKFYRTIGQRSHFLAWPLHSKHSIPMRLPIGFVCSHGVAVFASESDELYGTISSSIHRAWARLHGSTLGMTSRYTPTDCFETFPLPRAKSPPIGEIMRRLHEHRASLMHANEQGLTATYNRVHAPDERDQDVCRLREMHTELDKAVVAAYGWNDLDLDHNFRVTEEGLRYAISEPARIELLDRLLELNFARHAEESDAAPTSESPRSSGKSRKPKAPEEAPALILEQV